MIQKETGPHEFGRSGTALDPSHDGSSSVASDDSEFVFETQRDVGHGHDEMAMGGPLDGADMQTTHLIYDSGWTARGGFKVRACWYRVPDDGSRRRWLSDVLSRHASLDSEHTTDVVEMRSGDRREDSRAPLKPNNLASLIRCGACKGPVVSYTGRRYRCQKAKGSPLVPRRCQSPVYGQDLLDAAVWDKVRGAVSDPRVVMGLLAQEPSLGADLTGAEICRLVSEHIDEISIPERRNVLRIFGVYVELDGEAVEVRVQV